MLRNAEELAVRGYLFCSWGGIRNATQETRSCNSGNASLVTLAKNVVHVGFLLEQLALEGQFHKNGSVLFDMFQAFTDNV